MDLSRSVYSRDLKIAVMRALDAGSARGEIARKYQLSPKLLEKWRNEWRARGELAFPGNGRRGATPPAVDEGAQVLPIAVRTAARCNVTSVVRVAKVAAWSRDTGSLGLKVDELVPWVMPLK